MKTALYILMLAMLALSACGGTKGRLPLDIESFSLVSSIPTGMPISKALYQASNDQLFVMSAKTQEIGIFRGGERHNVLGGMGTGAANFLSLSDIGINRDGGLLALDSVAKSIKIFTSDGKANGNIELKGSVQPTLFCVHADQSLFVFDQATGEIITYSTLDGTEQYRFGKFELQQPTQLFCNRDYVVAYEQQTDTSHVFSVLGQFVKSDKGQTLFDDYNNGINFSDGNLLSQMSAALLPIQESVILYGISRDVLVLGMGEEIRLLKIGYLRVR
ncbi:MAG: hypothetical protein RBS43_02930 [Candidatus Cloacimonas sp.]|jgi:hypothetical protein|nr:hypothetical protein [Candidatus Cloacimonas sp.]